jgi:hypothetical protein
MSRSVKRVWVKAVFVDAELERALRTIQEKQPSAGPKDEQRVAFEFQLVEVNCRSHAFRVARLVQFGDSEKALHDWSYQGPMATVLPQSLGEHVLFVACSDK